MSVKYELLKRIVKAANIKKRWAGMSTEELLEKRRRENAKNRIPELKDGGCIYIADLSRSCIHIVDALLHWDHAEEALFSFEELEREANKRGFRTVKEVIDLGLEGYFRFQKE